MSPVELDWVEQMVLLERFRNDGSPTGFTWKKSSSVATCPRKSARWFALPLLPFAARDVRCYGEIPSIFQTGDRVLYPLHPDCVQLLSLSSHKKLIHSSPSPLLVSPTASPRTVLIKETTWRGFAKLDYPFVLGRFPRALYGPKLVHGLEISNYLVRIRASEAGICHFPEVGALEVQMSETRKSGVVFRSYLPTGPHVDKCFTFVSVR